MLCQLISISEEIQWIFTEDGFCCKAMAAGSWKPFHGSAGGQHATSHSSAEFLSCARASENKQEQLWGISKGLGKGMEKNQRSRTGSSQDLSGTLLSRSWRDLNCKWDLDNRRREDKAIQNVVKASGCAAAALQESDELKLNSWGASKHVLCYLHQLQGCCPACPPVWSLIWNRRSLNLSVSGNGYLT